MGIISTILLLPLLLWPAMSFFPIFQTLVSRVLGLDDPSAPSSPGSASQSQLGPHAQDGTETTRVHRPSAMDVVIVKMLLTQGLRLPPEVILSILDFAEYWPHTTALLGREVVVRSGRDTENVFLLRSRPLGLPKKTHYDDHLYTFTPVSPEALSEDGEYPLSQFQTWIGNPANTVEHPCRKVVFTITSHDQGWSGNPHDRGSYRGSCTWFEAGLERFDKNATRPKDAPEEDKDVPGAGGPVTDQAGESSEKPRPTRQLPDPYLPVYSLRSVYPALKPDRSALHHALHPSRPHTIQHNKTATRQPTTHKVVWSWNDGADPLTSEQLREIGRGEETGTGAFVRSLRPGDVVTVWAKSRYAGWVNYVESVKVDIYWAL